MATGGAFEDLECSICRETFLDPRALPCGHSFCGPPRRCLEGIKHDNDRASKCAICKEVFQISASNLKPLYGIREAFSALALEQTTSELGSDCNHHISRRKMWCSDCSVQLCGACVDEFHFDHSLKSYRATLINKKEETEIALSGLENVDLIEFQIANERKELQKKQNDFQKIKSIKLEINKFVDGNGHGPLSKNLSKKLCSNNFKDQLQQIGEQLKPFEFTVQVEKKKCDISKPYCSLGYNFQIQVVIPNKNQAYFDLVVTPAVLLDIASSNIKIDYQLVLVNSDASRNIETNVLRYEHGIRTGVTSRPGNAFTPLWNWEKITHPPSGFISEFSALTVKIQIQKLILSKLKP